MRRDEPQRLRATGLRVVIALAAVLAAWTNLPAASADILHLKGNRQMHGTILEEREHDVLLEIGNNRATFHRSRILRIERTGAETPEALYARREPGLREGDPAPDFSLQDLDGQTHHLASYRGKVVYLNFTATWCGPCKYHLPVVAALAARYAPRGVRFLTVSLDRDAAAAKAHAGQHGIIHPIILETEWKAPGTLARRYGPSGIPRDFLIDQAGTIRAITHGNSNAENARMEQALGGLL